MLKTAPLRFKKLECRVTRWTLGKLKTQNMQIHAACTNVRCGQSYVADPAALIGRFGAEADLSALQAQTCEACNAPLKITIGLQEPDEDWEGDLEIEPDDGQDDRHWD